MLLSKVTVSSLTYDDSDLICFKLTYDDSNLICFKLTYDDSNLICFKVHIFISIILTLSEMSTASRNELNLKLWNAAKDGDKDAVVAAISAGADKNWKNDSDVSDNDM